FVATRRSRTRHTPDATRVAPVIDPHPNSTPESDFALAECNRIAGPRRSPTRHRGVISDTFTTGCCAVEAAGLRVSRDPARPDRFDQPEKITTPLPTWR